MAKNYLFLVLFMICVSSLTIPSEVRPNTKPPFLAHSDSGSYSSLPALAVKPGSEIKPSNNQSHILGQTWISPDTDVHNQTSKVPNVTSPNKANNAPIIIFGVSCPLTFILCLTCVTSCCRRGPKAKPGTTPINTWNAYRRSRHEAMAAAVKRRLRSGKKSQKPIGLGLDLEMDRGSRLSRHSPRQPSPLRQVYPVQKHTPPRSPSKPLRALPRMPSPSGLDDVFRTSSPLPELDSPTSQSSCQSPVSDASPRTPRNDGSPVKSRHENAQEITGKFSNYPSLVSKYDADAPLEPDISEVYEAYFALWDEEGRAGVSQGTHCVITTT